MVRSVDPGSQPDYTTFVCNEEDTGTRNLWLKSSVLNMQLNRNDKQLFLKQLMLCRVCVPNKQRSHDFVPWEKMLCKACGERANSKDAET